MTDAEVGPVGAYRADRVPVAASFFTSLPESKHRLRNPPACRYADNKKDQANHQEQEEQEFGNPCGGSGNTRKSKKRRHQRDYKKNQGPTQHAFTSKKQSHSRIAARVSCSTMSLTDAEVILRPNKSRDGAKYVVSA